MASNHWVFNKSSLILNSSGKPDKKLCLRWIARVTQIGGWNWHLLRCGRWIARVTQISNLTNLAPSIQAEILSPSHSELETPQIVERVVRKIAGSSTGKRSQSRSGLRRGSDLIFGFQSKFSFALLALLS